MDAVRVLIVDDDGLFVRALCRSVEVAARAEGLDLRQEVATTYAQAAEAQRFDVALVDFDLKDPTGNGFDVLASMRARVRHRTTPALLITGHDAGPLTARAYLHGASAISKDSPAELVGCVLLLVRRIAARPRTPLERIRRFARKLSAEAGLSPAKADIVERLLIGESWQEVAEGRGVELVSARKQSKEILQALDDIGVVKCGDLRHTLEREMIESGFDDE